MQSAMRGLRLGSALSARANCATRNQIRTTCIASHGKHFSTGGVAHSASSSTPAFPKLPQLPSCKGNLMRRFASIRTPSIGQGATGGNVPPPSGGGGGGGGGGGSGGGSSGGGGGLFARYLLATEKNPILVKSLTAAVLNGIGDLIAQLAVEKKDNIDFNRLVVFTALGFLVIGPVLHFWYNLNSRLITTVGTKGAFMRMAVDQICFAPGFVALMFVSISTLEGRPQDSGRRLKQDWKDTIIANWKLWVPFQFINFRFMPVNAQVLFSSCVSLIWNTFLSFKSHTAIELPPIG